MNGGLIELRNICQQYRSRERIFTAVNDVNLKIGEGEFVVIVGPSGCGKSTLLRIVAGLQKPTSGEVLYRGTVVHGVNPHATIVFQTFALFPWLTVQQNVEVALTARGLPGSSSATKAVELLDRVGLDGFETAYPRELSGGMRQKVGFARAMAVEPELLCLDEPFSALDVLSAESLRRDLLELWTSGKIPTRSILMITHNIEEAVTMADRIIIMEKDPGRVVAEHPVILPYPRYSKDAVVIQHMDTIYSILAGQTQAEEVEMGAVPGEAGHMRPVPSVTVSELSGLMEYMGEMPADTANIYELPKELNVEADSLLRLSEAAEILGFATVAHGDISLSPLGETFVEASINLRKEIYAKRIQRLPLFHWVLQMLQNTESKELKWDDLKDELETEFTPKVAEKQLDVVIDWGRYAELISYDDREEVFSLAV
jgi:NitT/TauT family transport system ATP-binding protein